MKSFIAILFASAVLLSACDTNMDSVISVEDLNALAAMETAYNGAVSSNNSLTDYVNETGIKNDATCLYYDSVYHHYDSLFDANHEMYSHHNAGDDHSANDWHMGSGWTGGMMGGHTGGSGHMHSGFNASACTADNLEMMDSLMTAHDPYHVN